jgi:hypothetical protein
VTWFIFLIFGSIFQKNILDMPQQIISEQQQLTFWSEGGQMKKTTS